MKHHNLLIFNNMHLFTIKHMINAGSEFSFLLALIIFAERGFYVQLILSMLISDF